MDCHTPRPADKLRWWDCLVVRARVQEQLHLREGHMTTVGQPSERDQRVNEAIAAYLEAAEAGRAPGREEFLARYPDLANELTAFFADRDRFARAAGQLGLGAGALDTKA